MYCILTMQTQLYTHLTNVNKKKTNTRHTYYTQIILYMHFSNDVKYMETVILMYKRELAKCHTLTSEWNYKCPFAVPLNENTQIFIYELFKDTNIPSLF